MWSEMQLNKPWEELIAKIVVVHLSQQTFKPENCLQNFAKNKLKGTQPWDIFEFFFYLNQILICPW